MKFEVKSDSYVVMIRLFFAEYNTKMLQSKATPVQYSVIVVDGGGQNILTRTLRFLRQIVGVESTR